jgi:hypothetical protein
MTITMLLQTASLTVTDLDRVGRAGPRGHASRQMLSHAILVGAHEEVMTYCRCSEVEKREGSTSHAFDKDLPSTLFALSKSGVLLVENMDLLKERVVFAHTPGPQ